MKRIADMLGSAVGRPEILRTARANNALDRWEHIVGAALAQRCRPLRYDRGTVVVQVEGSAWAQEMRLMQDRIIARLNEEAGEPLFTGMKVTVSSGQRAYSDPL